MFCRKKEWVKVVDGIFFLIEKGEIFSLFGFNGVGKMMIIKILVIFFIFDFGKVCVKGFDVVKDDFEVCKVLIVVLLGEWILFWKLIVKENFFYFGLFYGFVCKYVKGKIDGFL